VGSREIVTVHAVIVPDVADDRLDGGTPSHLALNGRRHAALLARDEEFELVSEGCVVALLPGIVENAVETIADRPLDIRGSGCREFSYRNFIALERMTLRNTRSSRHIILIDLPCEKYARRILPIGRS
jgi:hypothetical protein